VKTLATLLLIATAATAQIRVVPLPSKSPIVTFRVVFTTGAAADPAEKPGLAALTAMMLAEGGTKDLTYKQIADIMFPMAAGFRVQVDKEMTAFIGETHVDTLAEYYKLVRARLLDPGWREDDFARIRDNAMNAIRVGLRNNDEEFAKEVLYAELYRGGTYGHYNLGTVSSLQKLTLEDVKNFYKSHYSQSNLFLGIAGGFQPGFLDTMKKDFKAGLPEGAGFNPRNKPLEPIDSNRAVIVEKDTRSVAISIGYPILTSRKLQDYPAMLLAASYLGQHRMSGGVLYDEMREKRGLNYGNYAYIEHFPLGMFYMEPPQNVARSQQIFQLWIRPVEPPTAKFALRLALFNLDKLVTDGISQADFERTRSFLMKYVNVLTRTKSAELGYAIDSIWYGTPNYVEMLKTALPKLTRDEVNSIIRTRLRSKNLVIVAVSNNAAELKRSLASADPSPMTYNSPKPEAVTNVDKIVEKWPLNLKEENIKIVQATEMFQ
jgi:zinc protease